MGRDDRVLSVAKNKSSRSGKQLGGFVMRGFELRSSTEEVICGFLICIFTFDLDPF